MTPRSVMRVRYSVGPSVGRRIASPACVVVAAAALIGLGGCRPDPGVPLYSDDAMPPLVRLTVGAFYTGPTSDSVAIDDSAHRLDVFSGTLSSIVADSRDRVDGQSSTALAHAGMPFWGMGIDWDNAADLSRWKAMHVGFKSTDAAFATFQISMNSGKPHAVDATAYGYKNDGNWHLLAIPISDFVKQGFDPSVTRAPFVIGGGPGTAGATLKVAALYFDENL